MTVRAKMSGARRGRGRPRVNPNVEENVNPDAQMWAQLMQQNKQMMHMMQQQIQQNAQTQQQWAANMQQGPGVNLQPPPPPPVVGNPTFREFNRNHPPEFYGSGEPPEAKRWIKQMEKIFLMVNCTEEDKVVFATNQFRGAALDWWETARRRMENNGLELNWENFKQVMKEKYLPLSYKVRKEQEFLHLKQGHMSVTDFTKKFEELSYYSTHNEYAGNEMWKVNQYKYALRGELYVVVSQQRVTDYDELVHNSLEAERGFDNAAREGSGASGRNRGNFADKYHDKLKPKGSLQRGKFSGSPRNNSTCRKCGKAHQGQCRMGTDNCFACGQAGHFVANCPNKGNKDKGVGTTMSKGRVYSLDGKKAQANEDLIGGCIMFFYFFSMC
jgi:hypothetical protein